jgi:hypothetical protein
VLRLTFAFKSSMEPLFEALKTSPYTNHAYLDSPDRFVPQKASTRSLASCMPAINEHR